MEKELILYISNQLSKDYSSFPVDISFSSTDDDTILIRMFCIPDSFIDEIESKIDVIEQEMRDAGRSLMLLPLLKSLPVTKEYYPDVYARYLYNAADRNRPTPCQDNDPWMMITAVGYTIPQMSFSDSSLLYNFDTNPAWLGSETANKELREVAETIPKIIALAA